MAREEAKALHGTRCLIHLNCVLPMNYVKNGAKWGRRLLFWVLCNAEENGTPGSSFGYNVNADMSPIILVPLPMYSYLQISLKSIA